MGADSWVKNKIELYEGDLVIFQRANSPNWYFRVYIQQEKKHLQKSCRTKNKYSAIDFAKNHYKEIQSKVAKEEKVFSIDLMSAVEEYNAFEENRIRRGMIQEDWKNKKISYLKNTFVGYFGAERKSNDITDKEFGLYIDFRIRQVKKKETIKQELVIIKSFYKSILLKQGYVFRMPEIPEIKIRKADQHKREDTFTLKEYDRLVKFMREWVKEKNVSAIRNAVKQYGKLDNKEKKLNAMELDMEKHRRVLMRELILIAANTGIRVPKEITSLKWGDIKLRKEQVEGMYGSNKITEQIVSVIQIGEEQKTGSRVNVAIAGNYFIRLKKYYKEKFDYEVKDNDFVFMEMVGRRKFGAFDRYALYRLWGELMRDCGLDRIKFVPYHLRHFSIVQQILNGVDLLLISKNVGNSISTISKYYSNIDMEKNTKHLIQRRDTRKEIANEIDW